MDNKRRFVRFDTLFEVELRPTEKVNNYITGIARNFSHEGLSTVSQCFDSGQTTVELRIKHPGKGTWVSVLGDIIWKKQINDRCIAGIKISEMEKDTKSDILVYAYNEWQKRFMLKMTDGIKNGKAQKLELYEFLHAPLL